MKPRLRNRRGFAMITALWLVVAITVVALQFSLEAHERYMLGINASERGVARAAAIGALALEQAQLERAIRQMATGGGAQSLRRSDPWVDVDSTFSGPVDIDSLTVMVDAQPGGKRLNVNAINEDQLKAFFNNLLKDASTADEISQSIMDWRDADDQARVRGGERDYYLKENKMVLPANAPFREVDDLLDVKGMTPEILEKARPFLRTYGTSSINVNTADEAVLRAVPGMTDVILARILARRTAGQRITTMNQIIPNAVPAGPPRPGQQPQNAQQQLANRVQAGVVFETVETELTITAKAGPQALPATLHATVARPANGGANSATSVTWRQW